MFIYVNTNLTINRIYMNRCLILSRSGLLKSLNFNKHVIFFFILICFNLYNFIFLTNFSVCYFWINYLNDISLMTATDFEDFIIVASDCMEVLSASNILISDLFVEFIFLKVYKVNRFKY